MLSDIGATFRRLFSLTQGAAVPDQRKRKRYYPDELEDDDSAFVQRKHARYDFHSNHQDHSQGWVQWAVQKPLRNYFVNSAVRFFRRSQTPLFSSETERSRQFGSKETIFSDTMAKNASTQHRLSSDVRIPPKCEYGTQNPDTASPPAWAKPEDTVVTRHSRRRQQPVKSRPFDSRHILTPHKCINLKEKEEFRLLLQHFNVSQQFGRSKKQELKDAATMASDATFAPVSSSSLQVSNTHVPQPTLRKKLHRTIIDLSDSKTELEDKKEERTQWTPAVPKASFQKILKSPYLSPRWVKDFKEQIALIEQDKLAQIKKQEQLCQKLRAHNEKELHKDEEFAPCALPDDVLVEEALPELTPDMEAVIDSALSPNPPNEVLASGFRLTVTRRDMETLAGLNWLNDEVINFYMNLLVERGRSDNYPSVYAFNTFFYPKLIAGGHSALKRWTRKVDLFDHDLVLVPVHLGAHWCLAVIDFRSKRIQYYDSMGGSNSECLEALREYLKDESLDKRQEKLDMSEWTLETVKGVPQQMNGSDCGMFALKYAEYISRNAKITFTQMNMPYFRRRMVYEILTKRLL